MIAEVLGEAEKSLKSWWRQRLLVLMGFMVPIVLAFFFTQAFNMGSGVGFPLAVVDLDGTPESGKLVAFLGSTAGTIPYFEVELMDGEEAARLFNSRRLFAVVNIPEGFGADTTERKTPGITVYLNNIHEDLSKNLRLGIEGRLYEYTKAKGLEGRPGFDYAASPANPVELRRVDYMQMGVLVFDAMFLGLLFGGTLGAMEKDHGTLREIKMAPWGYVHCRLGKTLASVLIGVLTVTGVLALNYVMYGVAFGLHSLTVFYAVFISLSFMFSVAGVTYGHWAGSFTLVPVPSILFSFPLWIAAGAINPLEFSAGSELFRFLPTAAAIRVLTAVNYGRGVEYLRFSWAVLASWFAVTLMVLALDSARRLQR
ncbi:ABC transporter permease [Candidatus Bathyarchaeota archaeon]|nr:ABC transporter permease [Candidatus Bathyarchaeota archaeon]